MGVGGHFWDLLKPYARNEGPDFLRDKRVAVDLSFWIVQHEAAIRSKSPRVRNPHLRTTFFRTVALFSKAGAYPVFVADGAPSPLKSQARIERFHRMSGLDPSELPKPAESEGEVTPVKQRNNLFNRYVRECVELLKLLGMPVLEARCEAEALCAQLNSEGHVDACLTADSDAFLFGAKCVIKCLKSNSKEPFECYNISDIEAGLGLRRKQMIAIALLVGNDYDSQGIPGFGVDTAVRFVQLYKEHDILDRLLVIGKEDTDLIDGITKSPFSARVVPTVRVAHCSNCGHPGSKSSHLKIACPPCVTSGSENCKRKPFGFKCTCSCCDEMRKIKEHQRHENWKAKMCKVISAQSKFQNNEIIALYLSDNHGYYSDPSICSTNEKNIELFSIGTTFMPLQSLEKKALKFRCFGSASCSPDYHCFIDWQYDYAETDGPLLKWEKPDVDYLVDFLNCYLHWEPSYIRQRVLPMLSTIYLREMASTQNDSMLLHDQYKFHSIVREKIRNGYPCYLVKWKLDAISNVLHYVTNEQTESRQIQLPETDESNYQLDEPDIPTILVDDGCCFLLTDENMDLVQNAFPKEVRKFVEGKRGNCKNKADVSDKLASPKSTGIQLSITEFYRSAKVLSQAKSSVDPEDSSKGESSRYKRKKSADQDKNLPKSVRRRLLFG